MSRSESPNSRLTSEPRLDWSGQETTDDGSHAVEAPSSDPRWNNFLANCVEVVGKKDNQSAVSPVQPRDANQLQDWWASPAKVERGDDGWELRLATFTRETNSTTLRTNLLFNSTHPTFQEIAESSGLPKRLFEAASEHNEFYTDLGGFRGGSDNLQMILRLVGFDHDGCCLGLSFNRATRITNAVILGLVQGAEKQFADELLVKIDESQAQAWHPAFLPLTLLEMRTALASSTVHAFAVSRGLEYALSHGSTHGSLPNFDEYAIVVLNTRAKRMALVELMLESLIGFGESISKLIQSDELDSASELRHAVQFELPPSMRSAYGSGPSVTEIARSAAYMCSLNEGLLLRLRQMQKRTDTEVNQNLAHSRQLMARRSDRMMEASLLMADASKRDSSAMKTISILTMVFLPATFIAVLFTMPLFQWDVADGDSVIDNHFWVYWAVTIPLTVLVLGVWMVWMWWYGRREQLETQKSTHEKIA